MICSDSWILNACEQGLIFPFEREKVSFLDGRPCISYGLSSYGYDIRLSSKAFLNSQYTGSLRDLDSDVQFFESPLVSTAHGHGFILDGCSFGLGVSLECFKIPENTIAVAVGKSSLARRGLQVNITPLEPGWEGYLTIEVINNGRDDILVYADQGIAQLLFFQGEPCMQAYGDGKYQHQQFYPTLAL